MLILIAVMLPIVGGLAISALARLLGDRLTPRSAVTTLTLTAVGAASASAISVAVVAYAGIDHLPVPRRMAYWLDHHGPLGSPIPEAAGLVAAVALALIILSVLYRAALITISMLRSHQRWARTPTHNGIAVIDAPLPDAFAVSGPRHRIVITRSLFDALPCDQRRALISHEQAHLDDHHQVFIQATELAATANPLLIPLTRQVRGQSERWADERAAGRVGRTVTARALTNAALTRAAAQKSAPDPTPGEPGLVVRPGAGGLSAVQHGVVERVLALRMPAPRPRPTLSAALIGLTVAAVLVALMLADSFEDSSEHLGSVHQTRSIHHQR